MQRRAGMGRWISGLFRTRTKAKLRSRRAMSIPYSAWVDVLENRELLAGTIPFTINVPTALANQGIYVAMYGSVASPVSNSKVIDVKYNIEWDANGNAEQVKDGDVVEVEQLSFTANTQTGISTATLNIPDVPNGNITVKDGSTTKTIPYNTYQLNGARLVFGVGNSPYLSVGSGGTVAAPSPASLNDPNIAQNYDFVEFTLDQAGMHINTTTVDQFGFPITVSATPLTSVAASSNGTALSTSAFTLNVASTKDFASQGEIQVMIGGQIQTINYTGKNDALNQFTGCTSTGTGTLLTGQQVWSISTYITPSGVGVQLDREDVFSNFVTYLGTTTTGSSPFLSSLTAGNTTSAGSIYQPVLASGPLSAHTGSAPITIQVLNISPNDPALMVNFGTTSVAPTPGLTTYNPANKVTTLTVTPPASLANTNATVDVTITSSGGTSPTYPNADYYVFGNGGTPTVTFLSTDIAPVLGGNKVLINGTNFSDPNLVGANFQVLFGSTPAAFTLLSTNKILAIVPNGVTAQTVNVSVEINGQTAANTPAFTYVAYLPTVSGLSSNSVAPGSTITITGKNFVAGQTTVQFGQLPFVTAQVINSTSLTVTVPSGASGEVHVKVKTNAGTSPVTPDDIFTYPSLPTYSAATSLRLVNPSDILSIESNLPVAQYAKVEPAGSLATGAYYYVITATSNTGESIASTYQTATVGSITGYNSIAVTWTPFLNATGYNIYRSTSSTGPFQYLAHVNGGQSTAFLDDGSAVVTAQQPPTNIYTYDPLASYFDSTLISFFNHYAPTSAGGDGATFSLTYGTITFTGQTVTDATGTYLNLTGTDGSAFQVYRPLFNTNTNNASYPPPPPGFPAKLFTQTPGQMVFACDGVFAFATGTTGTDNANSLNVENVIAAALNRGLATLNNFAVAPSVWGVSPADFYTTGSTANFYAGFMHQSSVSISDARPGGAQPLAYGFAYDDQAGVGGNGYGSYFTTPAVQPTPGSPVPNKDIAITVNFGSWTSATSMKTVAPPTFSVLEKPLSFKVQLADQNGAAVFLGGQEITLKVTGPWRQTNTYTLITAPDGTVTGTSTTTGKPVEINRPGNYTLTFSADGLNLVTEKLRVSPRQAHLKRWLTNLHPSAEHNRRPSWWQPPANLHTMRHR